MDALEHFAGTVAFWIFMIIIFARGKSKEEKK